MPQVAEVCLHAAHQRGHGAVLAAAGGFSGRRAGSGAVSA